MNDVIIHNYTEPDLLNLTPNSIADCRNCMLAEKTQLLDGGEGYLCKASLYNIETLACFVPAGQPTQSGWIPVTDKLPEPLVDVLVYDHTAERVEIGFITRHFEWVGVCMNHEVSHWMPMPEGPANAEPTMRD